MTERLDAERAPASLATVGRWAGLGYLLLLLGYSALMQWRCADCFVPERAGWLQAASMNSLVLAALAGVAVAAVVLGSRTLPRAALLLGILVAVWVGSVVVHGQSIGSTRGFLLALCLLGLAWGTAAAPPRWSGWALFVVGAVYVLSHYLAAYRNYYSLDGAYQIVGRFLPDGAQSLPVGAPYPDGTLHRAFALVRYMGEPGSEYMVRGFTGNPNRTGNYLAPLVAFCAVFALRWDSGATRGGRAWLVRLPLFGLVAVPGYYLLYVLEARTALAGALLALVVSLVPLGWLRQPASARLAALMTPMLLVLPALATAVSALTLNGREITWSDWWGAVSQSPILGIGPPGSFAGQMRWSHAHNDLFQAWSLGGLFGLAAMIATMSMLAWFAVRYWPRDDRALLAVLTSCVVLMSMEVLNSVFENWPALGLAALVAVAGRSLAMMETRLPPSV